MTANINYVMYLVYDYRNVPAQMQYMRGVRPQAGQHHATWTTTF